MQLSSPYSKQQKTWFGSRLLLVAAIFISLIPGSVLAQEPDIEPQIVTAIWETQCGDQAWPITIEVWNVGAAGGDAYAQAAMRGQNCVNGRLEDADIDGFYGTFSGGPNGVITFNICADVDDPSNCLTITYQFVDGKQIYYGEALSGYVVQNPEAFDAWMVAPITSEYIYTTYGIQVQDSFGDDQWEQKSWSDQELIWLNDVLKELPPGLLKKMALTRIVRNKVQLDENGNPLPNYNGGYYPCGSPPEKDCTASSGTIRIFDNALNPTANFPDGPNKFKAILLHEMTHALQYYQDENTIYRNAYASPLMQNYMDATRNITDIYDQNFNAMGNGWMWGSYPGQNPSWHLWQPQADNQPPTNYGGTNPKEDMSDSVMMYVYQPEKLKASSIKRYNAIRDLIFGGIEYENGLQKKP